MANRMLLVGWDAADWKILHPLIDAGEMPALGRIVEAGSSGQLLSAQPLVPAAQWTSLVTGKRPWQHRVCHPIEKITDANEAVRVGAGQRRSLAVWEMLAMAEKRSIIVGWPATHGGRNDNVTLVSDFYALPTAGPGIKPWPPAAPGTYWPTKTGRRLDQLRVSPADVSSGIVARYIPDWKKIDQKRDPRLGQLRVLLATDFSHQGAILNLLSGSRWDFAAVRFPALGAICKIFLLFHPPKSQWVPEADFSLYQNVLRAACWKLDQMLGFLVQAAGKNTSVLVVSPFGAQQQVLPPPKSPADNAWISPRGIFAACGPGFAPDSLVCGATVLDLAPTILTWFGLPIGDDMEGRVLIEGFASAPEVTRVDSWEPAQAPATASTAENGLSGDHPKTAVLRREIDWNLAQSLLEAGRQQEALVVLDRLVRSFPERLELVQALFYCQLMLQKLPEAAETLEMLCESLPAGIFSLLPRAELCLARKEMREARSLVNEAWNLRPAHPDALRRLGLLLLRLREWDALAAVARRALELDNNEPLAWLGLAEAQLRKRQAAEAEEAALRAIGLNYYLPQAHFVLARALIAQGKWQPAREAMQVMLQLQPNHKAAASYAKRWAQPPAPSSPSQNSDPGLPLA